MGYLAIACRCAIGLVFLGSATGKLHSKAARAAFEASIVDMRIVPRNRIRLLACTVICAELAIPLLLSIQSTAVVGFALALGVLTAFSAGIIVVLNRGTAATCQCFGLSGALLGIHHVVRNAILWIAAALGGTAVMLSRQADIQVGGVVVAVAGAFLVAFIIVILDELMALFRPSVTV